MPHIPSDIEHMLYLFLDYQFAAGYWRHTGKVYDMNIVTSTTDWLLDKLANGINEEFFFGLYTLMKNLVPRKQKSLERQICFPGYSYDWSFNSLSKCRKVKKDSTVKLRNDRQSITKMSYPETQCWCVHFSRCNYNFHKNCS